MVDRTDHYVPTNLYITKHKTMAELGKPGSPNARLVEVALGDADEFNRNPRWWWARLDQAEAPTAINDDGTVAVSGEHWTRFDGHRVQIDIEFSTFNYRETNDWKGRDEIRKDGRWALYLNRIRVWSGGINDPIQSLRKISDLIDKLTGPDCPVRVWSEEGIAELKGRQIYYREVPAIVTRQMIADEGRLVITAAEDCLFPATVYEIEESKRSGTPPYVDDPTEVVTTMFDPNIWWWRE